MREGKPLKSLSGGKIDRKLFRVYVSIYPLSYRTAKYIYSKRYVNLINTNDDDVYPCKYACCYSSRERERKKTNLKIFYSSYTSELLEHRSLTSCAVTFDVAL